MNQTLSPEEIDRLARKRANAKLGWYIHACVYVLVNLFIFALSDQGFGERAWSVKPLLGWGLGLALHGVSVWFFGPGGSLHARLLARERELLQRQQERQ